MHHATLLAFVDELNSIEKQAGFMRDAAMPWVGRHSRGVVSNLAETAGGFLRPGQAIRQGWKTTIDSFRPGVAGATSLGAKANLALMGGGTVMGLPEVVKKEDPRGKGRSRVERGAGFIGSQVGGLIGAPFGISGGIASGVAGDAIGRRVGRAVDRVRGYKPKPKTVQDPGVTSA
jgi:hypothetical protein